MRSVKSVFGSYSTTTERPSAELNVFFAPPTSWLLVLASPFTVTVSRIRSGMESASVSLYTRSKPVTRIRTVPDFSVSCLRNLNLY